MNKKYISGSLTNQYMNKRDPKLSTEDQFIVGVNPVVRSFLLSAVKGIV